MPVEFIDNRIKVKEMLKNEAAKWLEEASGEIESQTVRNSRVSGSQLKGSWQHVVDEEKLEAFVGSTLENAIWEEFGTGEHALKGNGRKTPWYVPVDGYKGKKKPTFNGKVVIVYGKSGKAFYKTNGKKPNRALFKAYEERIGKLIARAESIFKDID